MDAGQWTQTSDVNRKPKIWYRYQENTNTKSVFGISVPNFLVFYRYFVEALVKIWLNIGIFWQN